MKTAIFAILIAATTLTGCAGLDSRDQRILGGAAVGGLIGNAVGGGAVGTLGGAAVGGLIGNEVDRNAKEREQSQSRYDFNRRYNDCTRYQSRRYCDQTVR